MNRTHIAAGVAVVLALVSAGSALAGTGHGREKAAFKAHVASVASRTHVGSGSIFDAATTYLQIDTATLFAKLKSGESLAQIAVDQGKTSAGLIDAVVAAAKTKLDARVAAGKLDSAKETTLLGALRTQLGTLVTKSFGARTRVPEVPSLATSYLKPVLDYLQIDGPTLIQQLRSGKSLAEIAVANGKTEAGLTASIVGPIQTRMDAAVAAGKLTAAQRDALLTKVQSIIQKLVERSSF